MQRLFFHNKHDAASREILAGLDETVKVYDVFGGDILPDNIRLSVLPYMIDKQITLETLPPYNIGIVSLQFFCRDYQNDKTNDNVSFVVEIGGDRYDISSINGVLDLEIECSQAVTILVSIDGFGYMPFSTKIEVI